MFSLVSAEQKVVSTRESAARFIEAVRHLCEQHKPSKDYLYTQSAHKEAGLFLYKVIRPLVGYVTEEGMPQDKLALASFLYIDLTQALKESKSTAAQTAAQQIKDLAPPPITSDAFSERASTYLYETFTATLSAFHSHVPVSLSSLCSIVFTHESKPEPYAFKAPVVLGKAFAAKRLPPPAIALFKKMEVEVVELSSFRHKTRDRRGFPYSLDLPEEVHFWACLLLAAKTPALIDELQDLLAPDSGLFLPPYASTPENVEKQLLPYYRYFPQESIKHAEQFGLCQLKALLQTYYSVEAVLDCAPDLSVNEMQSAELQSACLSAIHDSLQACKTPSQPNFYKALIAPLQAVLADQLDKLPQEVKLKLCSDLQKNTFVGPLFNRLFEQTLAPALAMLTPRRKPRSAEKKEDPWLPSSRPWQSLASGKTKETSKAPKPLISLNQG